MPELPEVETVRRQLVPVLTGVRIADVDARRPDLRIPFPPRFRIDSAVSPSLRSPGAPSTCWRSCRQEKRC